MSDNSLYLEAIAHFEKLLAEARASADPEATAMTLASELYAQTAGIGPDWEKAAALGATLDPGNPLDFGDNRS